MPGSSKNSKKISSGYIRLQLTRADSPRVFDTNNPPVYIMMKDLPKKMIRHLPFDTTEKRRQDWVLDLNADYRL